MKTLLTVGFPMRTTTGQNARACWQVRARRAKVERANTGFFLRSLAGEEMLSLWNSLPLVVTLTRTGPRQCDDDNLVGGLKHVRDGVADFLGVDDGNTRRVTWKYAQKRGQWGVEVKFQKRGKS